MTHKHTVQTTMFSFSKYSEKMVFPKNRTGIWSFLYHPEKMMFLFPGDMILFFRRKMKDDFSQKIHGNMTFFSNVLKRWSFQKNHTGIWSFLYHQERWNFFFSKIWYFFYGGKWKMVFLKKCKEIWCFLYIR